MSNFAMKNYCKVRHFVVLYKYFNFIQIFIQGQKSMTKIPKNTKKVKKVITNNKSKLTFKLILTKSKMNIIIKEMK